MNVAEQTLRLPLTPCSRRRILIAGGTALGLVGLATACQSTPAPTSTASPTVTPATSASPAPPASASSQPALAASVAPSVSPSSAPVAQAPALLSPGPAVTINYGNVSSGPTELGIQLAESQGFFADYGVTLNHVVMQTSTSVTDALVGRSVDVTSVSPPSLVVAYTKGATDLALIAVMEDKATYTLVAAKEITAYSGLQGQTIGISSPGDGLTVLMEELLAQNGLQASDYNMISLGASGQRYAALLSGQVAAVCITQPFDFQLEHQGYNRLGDVSAVAPQFSFGGEAARRSWLQDNMDAATRFLAGAIKGQQFLVAPANQDAVLADMQSYLQMSADDAQATYNLLITQLQAFPADLTPSSAGLAAVIDVSVKLGDVTPPGPTPSELLDLDPLHAAQQLVQAAA